MARAELTDWKIAGLLWDARTPDGWRWANLTSGEAAEWVAQVGPLIKTLRSLPVADRMEAMGMERWIMPDDLYEDVMTSDADWLPSPIYIPANAEERR